MLVVAVAITVPVAVAAVGLAEVDDFAGPVTGEGRATRSETVDGSESDAVSFSFASTSLATNQRLVSDMAYRVDGSAAAVRDFTVPMTALRRGAADVQVMSGGWAIPMAVTALPVAVADRVMSSEVARGLARRGTVVMGRTSAQLRGARVGDVLTVGTATKSTATLTIGAIASDTITSGSELVVSPETASMLGANDITMMLLWGFPSRDRVLAELQSSGVLGRSDIKVRRSWDPPDPDSTMGLMATKAAFGEFAYLDTGGEYLTVEESWKAAHLPCGPVKTCRELIGPSLGINARCHNAARAALSGALEEVYALGLAATIDVNDTNKWGGCYVPRFIRGAGALGSISRHTWGQAFDINPTANCVGCVPVLDCAVVRVFRKWGFAWGGNFRRNDGMHFEYMGPERRDTWSYPSKYCPNDVRVPGSVGESDRGFELFADAGIADH